MDRHRDGGEPSRTGRGARDHRRKDLPAPPRRADRPYGQPRDLRRAGHARPRAFPRPDRGWSEGGRSDLILIIAVDRPAVYIAGRSRRAPALGARRRILKETAMPEPLTPLERRIYHYLIDFLTENTYQPSIREIGKKFRVKSTKTVSDLLQSLADKGYIERDPSRSRGVRLLGFSGVTRTVPVPYYGKIHAGEPSLLPEHRQGFLTMDRRFVPHDESFFLKVKGDSMIERGIFDGDFVMIDPVKADEA